MNDRISIQRIKLLHPEIREAAASAVTEAEKTHGITLRITQGLRTIEEQDALYAQGRSKPGPKVTNAKGGASYHNYGLAIDLVQMVNGSANWQFDYGKIVTIMRQHGFHWGGHFRSIVDKPHFEISFGFTWRELFARYNAGMFISGTRYVSLLRD